MLDTNELTVLEHLLIVIFASFYFVLPGKAIDFARAIGKYSSLDVMAGVMFRQSRLVKVF